MRRIDIFNEESHLEAEVQGSEPLTKAGQEILTIGEATLFAANKTQLSPNELYNDVPDINNSTSIDRQPMPSMDTNFNTLTNTEQNFSPNPALDTTSQPIERTLQTTPNNTNEVTDIDLEVPYNPESHKPGLTVLLFILLVGSFGAHRFYIESRRYFGALCFVLLGIPQILIIALGLSSGITLLPPIVMETSSTIDRYSWLTTYWSYAKYVALFVIALEAMLLIKGKITDEVNEVIKIEASDRVVTFMILLIVAMIALLGLVGSYEAKRHEDPLLTKINNATRYSN